MTKTSKIKLSHSAVIKLSIPGYGAFMTYRHLNAAACGLGLLCAASVAQAQSLDPAGSGVISGAMGWLQGTLLGTVATVAAVIAVAGVGFMTLTGRMSWRHAATVVLGCF